MKNVFVRLALLTLIGTVLTACVTINIYFPAAAAEKAADKIIEEVWQLKKPEGGGQDKDKGTDESMPAESASQPAMQPRQPPHPPQQ